MAINDVKIGHFMVAVGSIIQDSQTGKVLLLKRNDPFHQGEWEIPYGRLDQHEEILEGLSRELWEETGITTFSVIKVVRLWHIYRGEKSAETEVFGTTFHIQVASPTITLSDEHSEYQWVDPASALELITVKGILADMQHFVTSLEKNVPSIAIADKTETNVHTLPTVISYTN